METKVYLSAFLLAVLLQQGEGSSCSVSGQRTYTTLDASVLTNIAYISEFEFSCGKASENLYAEVETTGALLQLGKSGNNYLVSWTEDVAKATKGDHSINLYNEDGYNSLRKAQKSGVNSNAVAVGKLTLNHPGAYTGPWLNSEHLAAILGVLVGYLAISSKSKLLA